MNAENNYIEVEIERLGGLGDGIAKYNGKNLLIPHVCPGDKVKAAITQNAQDHFKAQLIEILEPSKYRKPAQCSHFGTCGGCSLQHLSDDFKRNILKKIANDLNIESNCIKPLQTVTKKTRRRAEFKIKTNKNDVYIGFYTHQTNQIVDLKECHVTDDKIMNILPKLKLTLQNLKKPSVFSSASVTILDDGLDVLLTSLKKIKANDLEKLEEFAKNNNICRMSYRINDDGSIYNIINKNSDFTIAGTTITLPNDAFLQASYEGQDIITDFILNNVKECENIADLYSGCGTYSLPLLKKAKRIAAYEGNQDMVLALHNAAAKNDLSAKISAHTRDLFQQPLKPNELNIFDCVIINPPRNGALPQVVQINKSDVKNIIMVSCNPATFKRDAQAMINSGYKVDSIVAIDQFLWSRHLEIVAAFSK